MIHSWNTTLIYDTHNVTSTLLADEGEGNYSFVAYLYLWNDATMMWQELDSDYDSFVVYNFSNGWTNDSTMKNLQLLRRHVLRKR